MPFRSRKSFPTRSLGLGLVLAVLGWAGASPVRAGIVITGSFGPNGDLGFVNSPPDLSISFGSDGQGQIAQMDGFVDATNAPASWNTSGFGTSAN